MTTVLTANAVVTFDSTSGADHLSASLDTSDDGLNKGRSTFLRGATGDEGKPAFLVWSSLGNPAASAATRGVIDVEAAGGALVVVASNPTVASQHEQEVIDFMAAGQATLEVALSPPAASLPSWVPDHGVTVAVQSGSVLRDGSIGSIRLVRSSDVSGAWVVGKLKWTARARAYRVTPSPTADRVVLLVSGAV